MTKETYYIEVNDGVQWSNELTSLKAARKELKAIRKEDIEEFGCEAETYRIIRRIETDTAIFEEEVI